MTLDVFDIMKSGHARPEYLLHPCGIPWYVTTSQHLIDNLTSAQRRLIFNDQYWTDGGDNYIADVIPGYPLLQIPEKQSFKVQPGFGKLTGGTWTAEIADRHVVNSWHGQTRDIYGLEGLTAIADPRQDSTIGVATLKEPFRFDDTEIVVEDDIGGLLNARIAAAAPLPYYLWVNGECFASDGIDSLVGTTLTISTPTGAGVHGSGWRGLLRSKNCGHFTHKSNSSRVMVTDAPLNGILGRPYCLWEFARLRDGTYADPFLLRNGPIGLDLKYNRKKIWQVQCLPWLKWLDRDVELPKMASGLRRFTFSRGTSSTLRQEPPLRIYEMDIAPTAHWSRLDIWLCALNGNVTFETLEELYAAVAAACTAASAADGTNTYTYQCNAGGPYITTAPTGNHEPLMSGPLAAILRWGDIDADSSVDEMWQSNLANYHVANKPENEFWWPDQDANGYNLGTVAEDDLLEHAIRMYGYGNGINEPRANPPYIIQWRQNDATCEDTADDETDLPTHGAKFPLTPCGPANEYRIWVDPVADASDAEDGDVLQLGDKLTAINLHQGNPNPTSTECTIDDVGTFEGDPAESYFDVKVVDGGFSPLASTVPFLKGIVTDLDPVPADQAAASFKKFSQGMFLYYIPELHEKDPWAVGLNYQVGPAENMSWILRAIVGENMSAVNVYCPEHVQADDIPDLAPGKVSATWDNQNPMIDWDSWDLLLATATIPGVTFRVDLGEKFNLLKFMTEELKFYGGIPIREPDPDYKQFVYRYRRAQMVNATMANLGGRRLQADNISAKGADIDAMAEQAASWVLNKIQLKFGFDPFQDKYLHNWTFPDASGFAIIGGRTSKINVETRITQINANEPDAKSATGNHFIAILNRFTRAMPIFRCGSGIQTLLTHGLGTDVLCTYNAVHNPYQGGMGIAEQPGVIVEWTHDPKKAAMQFAVQIAEFNQYGWPPTICVADTDSTKLDNDNVRIDDIEGNGQMFCAQTDTTAGWFDHWFFDCLVFNQSMSDPEAASCSCGDYGVVMWELDTETPTVYTGAVATAVSTGDYAAGGPFMVINDPLASGMFAAFDNTKRYGITFCDFDHADLQSCQRRWVYQADTSLELVDSAAAVYPARRWL